MDLNDRMSDLMIDWMRLNDEVKNEMMNVRLMNLKNDSVDLMFIGSVFKMKIDEFEWLIEKQMRMIENDEDWYEWEWSQENKDWQWYKREERLAN